MQPSLGQARLDAFATLSEQDVAALLAAARMLQRAAQVGPALPMLRGKNLGLVWAAGDAATGDAALFRRAAVELGARVAHVRPRLTPGSTPRDVQYTARMLGRLYDALECQSMTAELVQRMRLHADVPFFDGLASPAHPTARIAELMDASSDAADPRDRRRYVLQAVLLEVLG